MLYDGIKLAEGSDAKNLVVETGTSFPTGPNRTPDAGELFYRTDAGNVGLWVFDGFIWQRLGTGSGELPDIVPAGTYRSVTVSTQGLVTAGTNPTTVADYGITDAVTVTGTQTLTNKTVSGGVHTGTIDIQGSVRSSIISTASSINCSLGNFFTSTVNGNTAFTFSNAPSGKAYSFVLQVTHVTGTIEWPIDVLWPGGIAPVLDTGKTHFFVFVTTNGGAVWRGSSLVNYQS